MTDLFELEKLTWTQEDYKDMGWHDTKIHGIAIESNDDGSTNYLFDIDYIFKWVASDDMNKSFKFWLAPCTLVFHRAHDLLIEMDSGGGWVELLEIEDIEMTKQSEKFDNKDVYCFNIQLLQGEINLKANGYSQYVNKSPILVSQQFLTKEQRGEICFNNKLIIK